MLAHWPQVNFNKLISELPQTQQVKHVREEIGREGKEPKEGRVVGGEVNNTRGQVLGLDAEVLEKTEDGDNQLAVNEHFNLLESEFGVAGGA